MEVSGPTSTTGAGEELRGATVSSPYHSEIQNEILLERRLPMSVLRCPLCGGILLHQVGAETRWRDAEDGDGLVTNTSTGCSSVVRGRDSQMPGRRDSIDINFYCEECHGMPGDGGVTMRIQQHKGETWMFWVAL